MASSPIVPMAIIGGTAYFNDWYNGGSPTNVKPLLFAGIAGLILSAAGAISPQAEKVTTAVAWLAVLGYFIAPSGSTSPLQNIFNIANGKGK